MVWSRARRGVIGGAVAAASLALFLGGCETIHGLVDGGGAERGAPAATFGSEPEIRVRVMRDQRHLDVVGPRAIVVRPLGGAAAASLASPVKVDVTQTGLILKDGAGKTQTYPMGTAVELLPIQPAAGQVAVGESMLINGKPYPGIVQLRIKSAASPTFDVVMDMPVELYLPGVLEKELFKDWPRQAFEAQAVAARTYALFERERARAASKPFDVEATDADQVFGGSARNVRAIEAVRMTRGQVITSGGKLIRAYFSSQCGGRPASAATAWSLNEQNAFNRDPALQAAKRDHYCQSSRLYRWTVTRPDDDLSRRLREYGKVTGGDYAKLTRLRAVEVASRNKADRPERYRLLDAGGSSYLISPEELRVGCNYTVSDLPPVTAENRVNSGDLEISVWATQVRITGRGFGHGVGMCQYCAKGMADARMDWPNMIRAFFPGASVTKAY